MDHTIQANATDDIDAVLCKEPEIDIMLAGHPSLRIHCLAIVRTLALGNCSQLTICQLVRVACSSA